MFQRRQIPCPSPGLPAGSELTIFTFIKPCEAALSLPGLLTMMECPLHEALGIPSSLSMAMFFRGFPEKQPLDEPAPWPFIKTFGDRSASSKAAGTYLNNQLELIQATPQCEIQECHACFGLNHSQKDCRELKAACISTAEGGRLVDPPSQGRGWRQSRETPDAWTSGTECFSLHSFHFIFIKERKRQKKIHFLHH